MFVTDRTFEVVLDPNATTPQDVITLRDSLTLYHDAQLDGEAATARRELGTLSVKQWEWLILRAYIAGWRGPSFERDGAPIPCTPELINSLDPRDPLVVKAIEAAWAQHFPKLPEAPAKGKKKGATPNMPS